MKVLISVYLKGKWILKSLRKFQQLLIIVVQLWIMMLYVSILLICFLCIFHSHNKMHRNLILLLLNKYFKPTQNAKRNQNLVAEKNFQQIYLQQAIYPV